MRQLALSTSIFINSNVSRKKYIDELNYLSVLYERHIFSSDNSEERESILQMMGNEIKYLEYQEHLIYPLCFFINIKDLYVSLTDEKYNTIGIEIKNVSAVLI
ncbi:hypothetical protein Xenpb_01394 [Xenorhabdus sp. PB62.4]|nr:hypothetical protein [Xenorhabdus sp. PB62.4]